MSNKLKPVLKFEALQWLKENKSKNAFAGNRFGTTKAAITFIEKIYSLGAERIYIDNIYNESWRLEEEGGPYADTLQVTMPKHKARRRAILDILKQESVEEGLMEESEPLEDNNESEVTFWWD